jgi:predicted 2-oxoglutarate/Fe(II)-dependent dioxygenase YbiX
MHTDGSSITVNILLSDPSNFVGGGTYFEDDITVTLEQGDMIMHSGKTRHSGLKITEGKRYLLVFFIEIRE